LLDVGPDDAVLEIGTGLGYQSAILAQLARKVYSIEIIEELGRQAKQRLRRQGCTNVELKIANGYHGWSEHAPFDKVIVTAAPDLIPPPLIQQLKAGGKLVIPAGLPDAQTLILVEKPSNGGVMTKEILPVRFSQLEGAEAARRLALSRLAASGVCSSAGQTSLTRRAKVLPVGSILSLWLQSQHVLAIHSAHCVPIETDVGGGGVGIAPHPLQRFFEKDSLSA